MKTPYLLCIQLEEILTLPNSKQIQMYPRPDILVLTTSKRFLWEIILLWAFLATGLGFMYFGWIEMGAGIAIVQGLFMMLMGVSYARLMRRMRRPQYTTEDMSWMEEQWTHIRKRHQVLFFTGALLLIPVLVMRSFWLFFGAASGMMLSSGFGILFQVMHGWDWDLWKRER